MKGVFSSWFSSVGKGNLKATIRSQSSFDICLHTDNYYRIYRLECQNLRHYLLVNTVLFCEAFNVHQLRYIDDTLALLTQNIFI